MKKRITALVLAVCMCCTLLVAPVSAYNDLVINRNGSPRNSWVAGIEDPASYQTVLSKLNPPAKYLESLISYLVSKLGIEVSTNTDAIAEATYLSLVTGYGYGACSEDWLNWYCAILNSTFNSSDGFSGNDFRVAPYITIGLNPVDIQINYDSAHQVYRPYDFSNSMWITFPDGYYCFYDPTSSTSTDVEAFKYIPLADVVNGLNDGTLYIKPTSQTALNSLLSSYPSYNGLSGRIYGLSVNDDWQYIGYRAANNTFVLCDTNGYPICAPVNEGNYVGYNNNRGTDSEVKPSSDVPSSDPVPESSGDTTTGVSYNNFYFTLPDGGTNRADEIYFDNGRDAYLIQQSGYSLFGNVYNEVNVTYEITYNIEYTNITYIGATEEYTKAYNVYYTLPDGRSSADLTKEDLEQLNLSIDVVPYIRSSDDTRLRSLYHFDGNTEDASFWNYTTSFDWTTGASLTYLESNAFNGCLYFDELAHDFTITLPSSLGSGDFTVDFRYYQAHSFTPSDDSYISIGGQEVLRLTGSNFIFNGTNYATPVGNWNHLAFVRKDGTLYFYLNGVRQGSKAFSDSLSSAVQFNFGADQQTYKYLDELRVVNFAVWETAFIPPTVPYDTNLSLVLPTDTVPVAYEYWDISCENNLLSQYNLDWWDAEHINSGFFSDYRYSISSFSLLDVDDFSVNGIAYDGNDSLYRRVSDLPSGSDTKVLSFPYYAYVDGISSISLMDYTSLSNPSASLFSILNPTSSSISSPSNYGYSYLYPNGSLTWLLFTSRYSSGKYGDYTSYLPYGDYTLSMVSSNGDVGSFSFSLSEYSEDDFPFVSNLILNYISSSSSDFSFNGYTFSLVHSSFSTRRSNTTVKNRNVSLSITPTADAGEFVYLALEEGTESTVTAEFVSGVAGIPADDLNTPTLAVRSDIAINKKQIGGVRPTFAERGYVYAMVESGFITSLQQYTGYAWQAVDGRIWTGSRWIPYSSYNVITLSDMYDIADASGQGGYEYIYSQSGFWSWWQKQWLEFKAWYTALSIAEILKPGGGDTVIEGDTINNEYNVNIDFGGARNGAAGLVDFVQKVLGGIGDGFASFTQLYLDPDDSLDVLFPADTTDE